MNFLKRVFLYPLIFLFIIFEEFIYDKIFLPLNSYFKDVKWFNEFHLMLDLLPVWVAFLVMILSLAISEVTSLITLVMVANGAIIAAVIVYLFKIPLTVYSFYLIKRYELSMKSSIPGFAFVYDKISYAVDYIKHSSVYLEIVNFKSNVKPGALSYFKHVYTYLKGKRK
jgi:hypothetical protein